MNRLKKILIVLLLIISFSYNNSVKAVDDIKTVQLGGQTVGVAIYYKGLLVTDILVIEDLNGNFVMPAENAKLKKGDYILKANNVELTDISNLDAILSNCDGKIINLIILRDNKTFDASISPVKSKSDSKYHLGLLLKDSAAGIGTITFTDKNSKKYMALGHSINDADTGSPITVNSGRIVNCTITGVEKSSIQNPGELKGNFGINAKILGTVLKNSDFGLIGNINDNFSCGKDINIAEKSEISVGNAFMYSDFEDGTLKKYSIEIIKINNFDENTGRNFLIKITDNDLLNKTGGIVQGLSGSPIVQNNKLVGAVTHVLLSDPAKGYGIYIKNMLDACKD